MRPRGGVNVAFARTDRGGADPGDRFDRGAVGFDAEASTGEDILELRV